MNEFMDSMKATGDYKTKGGMDSRIDITGAKPSGDHEMNNREKDNPEMDEMEIDEVDHQADLTKNFTDYTKQKVNLIFPQGGNTYQKEVAGAKPKINPLVANLTLPRNTYLTPLPTLAFERQIDVNSKYVREGQNNYGAQ